MKESRIVLLLLFAALMVPLGGRAVARAEWGRWSEPVNISNSPGVSWFPELAVDGQGRVHVVWCGTGRVLDPSEAERLFYATWNGSTWLPPNDIVPGNQRIRRNALAVGHNGDLVLVFRGGGLGYDGAIFFSSAPAHKAASAAAWSRPRVINAHRHTYMVDLAVDSQGILHVLFDDSGYPLDDTCVGACADIYHRYSADGGRTWSIPSNLSESLVGSSRGQLTIDRRGTIHVTWDEGWDRLSGIGVPIYSVYRSSSDGGLSWSTPVTITYPITGTAQLSAGADGEGGVMLVWRTTSHDEIFCQWSADDGQHWSSPSTFPGVYARPWAIPFDLYDMAADSAGNIHLLVVGREIPEGLAPVRVYQLVWDGESWSRPTAVSSEGGFPEYPRLVISEGNHLHAVWFVRESLLGESNHEVWYGEAYSPAPHETPVPSPTPPPTVTATRGPTPSPTPTSHPTLPLHGQPPASLYTETDQVLRLALALSPLLVVLPLVYVLRKLRR